MTATPEAIALTSLVVEAAHDRGAEDAVALDVSDLFALSDIFVLLSGRSERNTQAIADGVEEALNARGHRTIRREGRGEGRWILLDFGDVIVHVFHQEDRAYYDLERLWKDCPAVPIRSANASPTL
jgi:ribosome-associated protein